MDVARFDQVAVADDERLDNDSAPCCSGVQRGGYHGLLPWALDSIDDYFFRSYVLFPLSNLWGTFSPIIFQEPLVSLSTREQRNTVQNATYSVARTFWTLL